jgi:hypothetical protein
VRHLGLLSALLLSACLSPQEHEAGLGDPCLPRECGPGLACFLDVVGNECSNPCFSDLDCGLFNVCAGGRCHLGCVTSGDCTHPGYDCNNAMRRYCAPAVADGGMPDIAGRDFATHDQSMPDLASITDAATNDASIDDLSVAVDQAVSGDLAPSGQFVGVAFPDSVFTAGDFDGDGKLDIVSNFFYHGNGDGTFVKGGAIGFASGPYWVGDVNSDGKLDYLTGTGQAMLGDGKGGFTPKPPPNGSPMSFCGFGDFDGDGKIDLYGNFSVNGMGNIEVARSNGDGTFAPYQMTGCGAPNGPGNCIVADLDGNQTPDIFMISPQENAWSCSGNGQGSLTSFSSRTLTGVFPIDAGRLIKNGAMTVVTLGSDLNLDNDTMDELLELWPTRLNNPVLVRNFGHVNLKRLSLFGDFDSDGNLDWFPPGYGGQLLYGKGDGTFDNNRSGSCPGLGNDTCGVAGDFNNDGKLDVALCSQGFIMLQQ